MDGFTEQLNGEEWFTHAYSIAWHPVNLRDDACCRCDHATVTEAGPVDHHAGYGGGFPKNLSLEGCCFHFQVHLSLGCKQDLITDSYRFWRLFFIIFLW